MAEFTDLTNVVPEVTDNASGTTFDVLQTFDINFLTDENGAQQVVVIPSASTPTADHQVHLIFLLSKDTFFKNDDIFSTGNQIRD